MELVTPSIGLVFWTTLAFLLLLFVLSKYAWNPILSAVKERAKYRIGFRRGKDHPC